MAAFNFKRGLILISLCASLTWGFDIRPLDILSSGRAVATGVLKKTPDLIPTPKELLSVSKNAVAGYPLEVFSTIVNEICSVVQSGNSIQPRNTPDLDELNFIFFKPGKTRTLFPLSDPEKLWNESNFDKTKNVTIFITGWLSDINSTNEALETMADAYMCRNDVNFVALDTAQYVNTLYTWSAFNTEEIGLLVGRALTTLIKYISEDRIHIIGHSLGAHMAGNAARYFSYETGKLIYRVTGLDPAKPCFNEGETLSGLGRGDAKTVDVIHSNSGILGKRDPTGDLDFYPGGLHPLPNGCLDCGCAHSRAWEFFAETVIPGNENNFMAVRCGSLTKVNNGKCPGTKIPMGLWAPTNAKGNYFLDVNGKSPFGLDAASKALVRKCNS